jgi:hypothetical protein
MAGSDVHTIFSVRTRLPSTQKEIVSAKHKASRRLLLSPPKDRDIRTPMRVVVGSRQIV